MTHVGDLMLERARRAERMWLRDVTRGFSERTVAEIAWACRIIEERVRN